MKNKRTYQYKSVLRPVLNSKGHYTGYMKAAGTHKPIKKTKADKVRDCFVKKNMDGSRVTSIEFDE